MYPVAQRVSAGPEKHQAEHVPLGLDVHIGTEVDADGVTQFAGYRIVDADQNHDQYQPE